VNQILGFFIFLSFGPMSSVDLSPGAKYHLINVLYPYPVSSVHAAAMACSPSHLTKERKIRQVECERVCLDAFV